MVEQISNLPENVLGFTAKEKVTRHDYESVIIPAVNQAFENRKKVRFLYHLGEEFSGFEAVAMWDDAKLGLQHLSGWERVAIVTDVEWIRAAMKILAVVMPGHVRLFHNQELAEAKNWIAQ